MSHLSHPVGAQTDSIDHHVRDLRAHVRDVGDEVDAYKAKTAAAMGGAVFCMLLSLGGLYDIVTGNASIRTAVGVSRETFYGLVGALGTLSITLFLIALVRERRRDLQRESRLAEVEQELCDLQEEHTSATHDREDGSLQQT
jgi:hypothetical protein